MNNKILGIIFVALLALYGLTKLMNKNKKSKSFKTELVSIDSESVSKVIVKTKKEALEIILAKEQNGWKVSQGELTVECPEDVIKNFLSQITDIKAKRLAATKKEKWTEYEVDEANGSLIQIFSGAELLKSITVGRFKYDPQRQTMASFIKLPDGPEVYAIDGFLPLSLQQGFNGFRSKKIVEVDQEKISTISVASELNTKLAELKDGQWSSNGKELDMEAVQSWIGKAYKVDGIEFIADPMVMAGAPVLKEINISAEQNVQVRLYKNPGEGRPLIIHSSQNESAFFQSDSAGIFQTLFMDVDDIF